MVLRFDSQDLDNLIDLVTVVVLQRLVVVLELRLASQNAVGEVSLQSHLRRRLHSPHFSRFLQTAFEDFFHQVGLGAEVLRLHGLALLLQLFAVLLN